MQAACRRRRPAFYGVNAGMQIVIIRREWTCQFTPYYYDRIFLFLVMTSFDTPIPGSATEQWACPVYVVCRKESKWRRLRVCSCGPVMLLSSCKQCVAIPYYGTADMMTINWRRENPWYGMASQHSANVIDVSISQHFILEYWHKCHLY